ncbi:MAG TPA: iron ABC transporter permease, partial [Dehalococcoidia bacterium]|nr:iron ABC transporter permease [Dehalococcoidia bacterium]
MGQAGLVAPEAEAAQIRLYLAQRRLTWPRLSLGLLALAAALVLGLAVGPANIPLSDTVRILLSHLPGVHLSDSMPAAWDDIIWQVRLPRVLTAGLVGATLAMSGVTYQGVFRNPLAEPYLIGVAAGAALGATIVIVSPLHYAFGGFSILPLAAFAGGLSAVAVTYAIARVGSSVPMVTLVLAGVAVSSLATSLTSLLMILETNRILTILSWTLGGFNLSSWDRLLWALPYILPAMAVILVFGRSLNVLQLDEDQAQQVGLEVERTRLLLLAASSLAAA